MSRFIVVRHAETEWSRNKWFQGRADTGLTEQGLKQAERAAGILAGHTVTAIVSSPLSQAWQTAEIIAEHVGLPVQLEQDLIECDFGQLEGTPVADHMAAMGLTRRRQLANALPEDAEAWPSVRSRAMQAMARWQEAAGPLPVLVSHEAVIQALAENLTGRWFKCAYAQPYRFDSTDEGWRIETL